jgi:hypothetical protein
MSQKQFGVIDACRQRTRVTDQRFAMVITVEVVIDDGHL